MLGPHMRIDAKGVALCFCECRHSPYVTELDKGLYKILLDAVLWLAICTFQGYACFAEVLLIPSITGRGQARGSDIHLSLRHVVRDGL